MTEVIDKTALLAAKSEAQVRENLGALEKGPLPAATMAELDAELARQFEPS